MARKRVNRACIAYLYFSHANLHCEGRVHVKVASRKRKNEISRDERRRKANQMRNKKREEVLQKKRAIGGQDTAPFLTAIIPLGVSANIEGLLNQLKNCDPDSKVVTTSRGVLHIKYNTFQSRIILSNLII